VKKSLLKTLRKIQSYLLPLFNRSSGVHLDLAIGISGFDKMILENATEISIGGENFSVATSEDLILMPKDYFIATTEPVNGFVFCRLPYNLVPSAG